MSADEHTVGRKEIFHRASLCKELGVRRDFKMNAFAVGVEDALHGMRGAHGKRAFFHNYLVRLGGFHDAARCFFPILKIGGLACAIAEGFCGSIYRYEENVGGFDGRVNVGREK